jgi:hypothetical protein
MLVQIGGIGAMLGPPVFFAIIAAGRWPMLILVLAGLWAVSLALFPRTSPASAAHGPLSIDAG